MYPDCPAAVRLGIGLCRYQLKQYGKAQQAFERVLQASDISFFNHQLKACEHAFLKLLLA